MELKAVLSQLEADGRLRPKLHVSPQAWAELSVTHLQSVKAFLRDPPKNPESMRGALEALGEAVHHLFSRLHVAPEKVEAKTEELPVVVPPVPASDVTLETETVISGDTPEDVAERAQGAKDLAALEAAGGVGVPGFPVREEPTERRRQQRVKSVKADEGGDA